MGGVSLGEGVFIQLSDSEAVSVWEAVDKNGGTKDGAGLKKFLMSRLETPAMPNGPLSFAIDHFKKNPQDLSLIMSGVSGGFSKVMEVLGRIKKTA